MPMRNGILTTLRAKGRTVLFTLLIFVMTVALTLGTGMWVYCTQLLSRFDDTYTSIVVAEYMGDNYPDADIADLDVRETLEALNDAAIAEVDGVKLWEHTDRAALLTDYRRIKNTSPYAGYGVVVASITSPMYTHGWGLSQASDTVLPETRLEIDSETMQAELYAPGMEPLALPVYTKYSQNDHYTHYVDSVQGLLSVDATADQLPELYVLQELQAVSVTTDDTTFISDITVLITNDITDDSSTQGYSVHGELPEGYDSSAPVYIRVGAAYEFYGEHFKGYIGRINRVLYTDENKEGIIAVFLPGGTDFTAELGKSYLLHGYRTNDSGYTHFAVSDFYPDRETEPWLELTGDDDPALTESIFADYADRYRNAASFAQVESSANIAALEVFQQGILYLKEGRFPSAGETGVCVISGSTAEQMDVGVGDTVDVSILTKDAENWYDMTENGDLRNWEIVGITNSTNDYSGWFWVSDAEGGFASPLFGYTLGRAVLDNRSAVQAVEKLQTLMPEQVRLTLYDQGYSAAAKPIQAIRTTSIAIAAASALGALTVLFLFAFLFVGRQRESVQVLVSMGTPVQKIRLWFLSGTSLIAFVAATLGATVGTLTMNSIITWVFIVAERLYAVDLRYSNAALGYISETPQTAVGAPWYAALSAAAVFVSALVFCLVFLRYTRRENTPHKGKVSVRVSKGKTSLFGRGAGRFAMLSARRGGWRSIVVPAAALVLSLLLGVMAVVASGWENQQNELYENSTIEGRTVSVDGRNVSKLYVSMDSVRSLWQSERLEDVAVSLSWKCGENSDIVALNRLNAAPEFYYTGTPEVEWLDGWDESFLSGSEYYSILYSLFIPNGETAGGSDELLTYPALVSRTFLEERDLALGDEWEAGMVIERFLGNKLNLSFPIKIVGVFEQVSRKQNVYIPLSFWCDTAWITDETGPLAKGEHISSSSAVTTDEELEKYVYATTDFGTCRFTLRSGYDLEPIRQLLADGEYSQVGKTTGNRITVVLMDQNFQEAAGGLGRYISFSRILFPALLLAVALIGFIISWLMINGRRMEFAVLRGIGASRRRVFATFFLEQAALCIIGCIVGALILTVFKPVLTIWLATAGFVVSYLAGCALSILAVGRTKLIELLSERE